MSASFFKSYLQLCINYIHLVKSDFVWKVEFNSTWIWTCDFVWTPRYCLQSKLWFGIIEFDALVIHKSSRDFSFFFFLNGSEQIFWIFWNKKKGTIWFYTLKPCMSAATRWPKLPLPNFILYLGFKPIWSSFIYFIPKFILYQEVAVFLCELCAVL
jgi:hypothetical protein